MKRMLFASIVENYSVPFQLIVPTDEKSGHYEFGEWVRDDKPPVDKNGAILPIKDSSIFRSGGTLTENDRQLFIAEAIPLSSIVIDGPNQYKVVSVDPFLEHYADVNIYYLKAVDKIGKYL
ncbi:hypothetical protein ACWOFR_03275 [Carnobacterium gallinarum]|uniref:hypothetical protein n=1 Tax=Carnobacterium gallinarum TaxID=2749 RepID=UPI00054EEA3F|nr:hypothetical protein [Carnobacterium gallinarum]